MRYISLFSGIEAASVAWEGLGWEPVAFSEIEPFCCALLAERYPDVPNLGDITAIDWKEVIDGLGTIDLVVGGSPCQTFSVAGNRSGRAGASGLMAEYIRAVREIRPRWFVWENVPGAFSVEGGAAFGQLLGEMDALGYGLAWRVLDAQFARVPMRDVHGHIAGWLGPVAQRRERVFLVGHLGDMRASEVLFEPEGMRGDCPSSREKRKELAALAKGGADGVHGSYTLKLRHTGTPTAGGGIGPLIQTDVSATLSCQQDQTLFQAAFSRTSRAKCEGDASTYAETGLANTLNTFDIGDGRTNELVAMTDTQPHATIADGSGALGALSQTMYKDPPVVIDRAAFNQGKNAQYPPHIEQTELMDTLVARGPHAVAYCLQTGRASETSTSKKAR